LLKRGTQGDDAQEEAIMAIERWNIDTAHSHLDFVVRHMVFSKVRGTFTKWSGAIEIDTTDPTRSHVSMKADVASIDTHEAQRDNHLRSGDFFEAEKHPELTFTSKSVSAGGEKFDVTGALTIRGVSHDVVLHVEATGQGKDPYGNQRAGWSAKASINRKDFGMHFNAALETGGVMVSDKVDIEIEIEAIKAA
jgi:polyisoprenoid-binding protein YceI